VGQSLPALTLDEVDEGDRVALTTNYLKLALAGLEVPANKLVNVSIGRVTSGKLFGYVETEGGRHRPESIVPCVVSPKTAEWLT
jgi:hypothetical protein